MENSDQLENNDAVISDEQKENNPTEENEVKFLSIRPLSEDELKVLVLQEMMMQKPEVFAETAAKYNLDLQKDNADVANIAYEENMSGYLEQTVMSMLDENVQPAYEQLYHLCYFTPEEEAALSQSFAGKSDFERKSLLINYRLAEIEGLQPILDFMGATGEAIAYGISGDKADINEYDADGVMERLENGLQIISGDEAESKLYYIASKMYRQMNVDKFGDSPKGGADGKELKCLHRILNRTTESKLIAYCATRLKKGISHPQVEEAYLNVLNKSSDRHNLAQANRALADICLRRNPRIGFVPDAKENHNNTNLGQAVRYLMASYRYTSNKKNKLALLHKISEIELQQGNLANWENFQYVIAMKFMHKANRCHALNKLADRTGKVQYYSEAEHECQTGRLKKEVRMQILEEVYGKMVKQNVDETMRQTAAAKLHNLQQDREKMYTQLLWGKKGKGKE